MAEQKKSKTPAKSTAKAPAVKQAKAGSGGKSRSSKTASAPKKETGKKESGKKETTRLTTQSASFGDSILDEVLLLVVIVVSIIVFVSLLTDKMGLIGSWINGFFQGMLGFSSLLLPIFVILYCVWMLSEKEKSYPLVRALGAGLFLLTAAAAAQVINPVAVAEGTGIWKRCGILFGAGAFQNGGLLGGLLGGGLHSLFDTLGSAILLLALGIISIVMATGKSFFHAVGDVNHHRKVRRKIKNEKIKSKAEQIRRQEIAEAERQAKKEERRRKMTRADYNIELQEAGGEETPYVKETVFRKKPMVLEKKKREPIFDYVKEQQEKAAEQKAAVKAAASVVAVSALRETAKAQEQAEREAAEPIELPEEEPLVQGIGISDLSDGDALIEEIFAEKPERTPTPIIDLIPELEEAFAEEEQVEEEQPEEEPVPSEEAKPTEEKKRETEERTEEIPTEPVEEEPPYVYPPIELLGKDPHTGNGSSRSEMIETARKLESTLKSFGVEAKVIQISKGPTVTRYELSPSQGVKVSKIVNLADDIALNLAASGIRIEAPIPGKAAVGIEVPNQETQSVYMRTLLESDAFREHPSKLAFALGQDIAGNPVVTDIAKMPHLLIAGATGSGKSVCINTLITSILYKADPKEVKLLLVDPKVVELSVYNGIPHLLIPVVTDPKKASAALNWAVREMLQRYNDFAAHGVRDIKGFNKMMEEKGDEKGKMSQIVIIIDELADLMMAAPGEVEDAICRLAQMARAAGMHLIIATQRPSVDVITGVIKANIPSRLAFAVSSGIDSRTILDMVGAEKLLGKGDMLFYPAGQSKPARLQGAFVTDQEVEGIVDFLKKSGRPCYTQETIDQITSAEKAGGVSEESDEFFVPAVELILEKEKASVSMLQRQFRIGYNRAARLMDDLERQGIVGPEEGSKPRRVLITRSEWEERTGAVPEEID